MDELRPCPFCGGSVLYEAYHVIDGFETPVMFCNGCKAMFFVEGSEDWVTDKSDGMEPLRIAWNRRAKSAYVEVRMPKETQERIKQMVHDKVREHLRDIGIIRCKDCEHSMKDGTLCRKFAAYEPIAGGDEYAELPAVVEPNGFCKWASPREDA